jgi:type IV secretion system protein VirB6
MYQQLRLVILLIVLLVSGEAMAASDPYGNCIKSYEFGGPPPENVVMAPINPRCQAMCKNECGSFSRKSSVGMELNAEAITNCLSKCQAGQPYESYIYEEVRTDSADIPFKKVVRGPYSINIGCTGVLRAGSNVYKSRMKLVSGDQVKLTLVDAENANKIYLCGKKVVTLNPIIQSLNTGEWNSTKIPQNILNDRTDNICALRIKDKDWETVSNKDLWSRPEMWGQGSHQKDFTNICMWNAKNTYFTDTGIWAKDGDELAISWDTTYIYNAKGLPDNIPLTRSYLHRLLSDSKYEGNKALIKSILDNQGSLQFLKPGAKVTDPGAASIELKGEGARIFKPGEQLDPIKLLPENRPQSAFWLGLSGVVQDMNVKAAPITTGDDCSTERKRVENYQKCTKILDPGIPFYSFKGVLNGGYNPTSFSPTPALIAVRHWQPNNNPVARADAVGGALVTIEWGGCPFSQGQMLQYAVTPEDLEANPNSTNVAWLDVPTGVFRNGDNIPIKSSGNFYLRIKPLAVPEGVPDELKHYYTDPGHRFGQYYINLSKLDESTFLQDDGIIKQIVNSVRYTLYGDPKDKNKKGVLRMLYEALVEETPVISAVRALLVLFTMMTGFGYLIGTVQMHQKDMITRLFKLAFVAMVISPGSWEFFSDNFFKLFIDGGLELIAKIITGSLGGYTTIINVSDDPASVFSIFDGPFQMMFSKQTWIKVYALFLTGMLGIIIAIFIAISAVFYFLSVAKVILMFLMSMVIISLLIFMAPLFLCFMLFNQTKSFFDSWWKFLLSFTLQPVALFSSIAIFNLLIVTTIFTALGFTACPSCLFGISIPSIVDFCLIPAWRILAFSHFPDQVPGFFLPIGVLEGSVLMLILTSGMYGFCEFIAKVTNTIVYGAMVNVSSLDSYGTQGIEAAKSLIGQDEVSKARRQQQMIRDQQKAQEEAKKKEKDKGEERNR